MTSGICSLVACGSSVDKGGNGGFGGSSGSSGTGGHGGAGAAAGTGGHGGAGAADGGTGDAATCQCRLEGDGGAQTLTISWDCFCAAYGCSLANSCSSFGFNAQRSDYPACGLTVYSVDPAGGPWMWVYDSSGSEVGAQRTSDVVPPFYCPSDHNLSAFRVRAGRFPESTCQGTTCACTAGADASVCSQTDAATK